MIAYDSQKTAKYVVSMLITATLTTILLTMLVFTLWFGYVSLYPNSDISAPLAATAASVFFLCEWIFVCTPCTSINATEDGLHIKTCVFFTFYVPWDDLVDIHSYQTVSWLSRRQVGFRKSDVKIKKGLTPLHRCCLAINTSGCAWPRGFSFGSAGTGYAELVKVIEQHLSKQ